MYGKENLKDNDRSRVDSQWDHLADEAFAPDDGQQFDHRGFVMDVKSADDKLAEDNLFTDEEMEEMNAAVSEYSEKIDPAILKKCFSEWRKRKGANREFFRKEYADTDASTEEIDEFADQYFLGAIYRDCLASILDQKCKGYDDLVLISSDDEDIKNVSENIHGWYECGQINMIKRDGCTLLQFLVIIAHETWHSHQYYVASTEKSERAQRYMEMCSKYKSSFNQDDVNFEEYYGQVMEGEARLFQEKFLDKMMEAIQDDPEILEELYYSPVDYNDAFDDEMVQMVMGDDVAPGLQQ